MTRVLRAIAREDHTAVIELPPEIAAGTELLITIEEPDRKMTGAELAKSEFAGMWAGRDDLPHSPEEFSAWRRKLEEGFPVDPD